MKIDVENGLIEVKSIHENAEDEISGRKPNTQRIVNDLDASMLKALQTAIKDDHKVVTIAITDTGTDEPPARREVTNIKFYGEELGHHKVTISWRHIGAGE